MKTPPRRKRSEAFFGIHFDFHARGDCDRIGDQVTARSISSMLKRVKPDYVQCDGKGHPGIASYQTKVGTPASGFVHDQLRTWRKVTAAQGVSLYIHYSGVVDEEAVKQHPDWALRDAKGQADARGATSVFGPYVEELMIPMLLELATEYGVDGVWIDGDCWGVSPDYSSHSLNAWREETGLSSLPKTRRSKQWKRFLAFQREGFRRYLRRYVDAVHEQVPGFEIASNWAYSGHMPEKPTIPVDFISGDFTPQNAFHRARWEARILAGQGRPWDLMAWSFNARWGEQGRSTKTPPQLQQEAAAVLSVGGGFQAYFKQKRDGSLLPWNVDLMEAVAVFCREREAYCHRADPVPQVGMILSTDAYYDQNDALLFRPWSGSYTVFEGVICSILDNQYSTEVVMEHQLTERMHDYPLLVYPEWKTIKPAFKKQLLDYVRRGGNLLVVGAESTVLFGKELGIRRKGKPTTRACYYEADGWIGGAWTEVQEVVPTSGTKVLSWLYEENEAVGPRIPGAVRRRVGKGTLAAVPMNMGERYATAKTAAARDFMGGLVKGLFPEPVVTLQGSHGLDVSVSRLGKNLLIHLVNTFGPHGDENNYTFDEIPPVGPVTLTVRIPWTPVSATLQPGSRPLKTQVRDGLLQIDLARVALYEIVVLQEPE